MQFPFSIDVVAPRWALWHTINRHRLIGGLGGVTLLAGLTAISFSAFGPDDDPAGAATLHVTSVPTGARIEVDGRGHGQTPAALSLSPGDHQLRLRRDGYTDTIQQVRLEAERPTALEVDLWLASPHVQQIRPAFPGARIERTSFLADGRVALLIGLPSGDEKQLWSVEASGALKRLGPSQARRNLGVSPDGRQVAYLAAPLNSSGIEGQLTQVWVGEAEGRQSDLRYELPATATGERLVDLSWAPDDRHLLLASEEQASGAQQTRLSLIDSVGTESIDLVSLPSEVVPGSYTWRPDGRQVAFLTHAGQLTSLCLLDVEGHFRYLADLSRDDSSPLPFPPITWSPDGDRLVYAGLADSRSKQRGWLFGPIAALSLFTADARNPIGERLGDASGQAPVWNKDGGLLAFARPKLTGPITLQDLTDPRKPRDLGELPLKPGSTYAARWDARHAQALVAVRGSSGLDGGRPEYWLVRYRDHARAPAGRSEVAR